jgi:two-component system nitrogen regulation response regulator NtrX
VASTQKDLELEIKAGKFREDLFHRINVVPFHTPALRDRLDDVPSLAMYFSEYFAREGGYRTKVFSEESIDLLKKHNWPGNVRELKNFVERLYILTASETLDPEHLALAGLQVAMVDDDDESMVAPSFKAARALFERDYISKKLRENQGNVSKTAESIGLERSHLHRKIKAYGIEVDAERAQ